jgi:hypothetical protein
MPSPVQPAHTRAGTRPLTRHRSRILCAALAAAAGLGGLTAPVAASAASSQASLYLTPSTGSPGVGDELDVQIRVNAGSQFTNAVQANFTYPSGQLSVLGFDNSTSSFPVVAQQQASNGLIQVAGGAFTPVTGDANLTTIRFQVIGAGTAQVCPAGQSVIVSSSTNQAISSTMSGATFVAGSPSSFGVGCIVHDWIAQGAKHAITIHGEGFSTGGATVTVSGTGVKTSGTTVASGTQLTTTITVPAAATTGFRDVTVTSGGQTYLCQNCLTVGNGPKVSSAAPATVSRGASGQVIALHGQSLDRRTTVKITGLTVTATTWVSSQEIDVTVNVPATVTTGHKKISLYDPYSPSNGYYGRGSCATCLTVS